MGIDSDGNCSVVFNIDIAVNCRLVTNLGEACSRYSTSKQQKSSDSCVLSLTVEKKANHKLDLSPSRIWNMNEFVARFLPGKDSETLSPKDFGLDFELRSSSKRDRGIGRRCDGDGVMVV